MQNAKKCFKMVIAVINCIFFINVTNVILYKNMDIRHTNIGKNTITYKNNKHCIVNVKTPLEILL